MSGTHAASLVADIGTSWLAKFSSLLVLPLANEDLAIIAGAYIVVNDLMPVSLVALGIYGGMVASDFALYGIGLGARRVPWLDRYAINDGVREFGDTLKRNIFGLVALCRLVPGAVFVVFVACGWWRVSFARFVLATLLTSALYLPIVLYLIIVFGDALDDHAGVWTWPLMFGAMLAAGFMRSRVFAFPDGKDVVRPEFAARAPAGARYGMLAGLSRKVAFGERMRASRPSSSRRRASASGRIRRAGL